MKNLFSIQKDSNTSQKLLAIIERQRKKNKYILWFVYFLLTLTCIGILHSLFGWMIPSFGSDSPQEAP